MPAPATVSAVWPLNVAIAAAILAARAAQVPGIGTAIDDTEGAPTFVDADGVYSGQVPKGTPLVSAYIVLSNSQQFTAAGAFRRRGRENVETIDVWTADQSKRTATIVGDALVALLDGADLTLADVGTLRGRCEMVLTVADPSTFQYRAQLRYTAKSFNPVPAP